jgi:putative transposase
VKFVDEHKDRTGGGLRWGVEPICAALREQGLQITPATYYAAKTRPPWPRALRDAQLKPVIASVRKTHAALQRAAVSIGRDRTARLMRELGLQGCGAENPSAPP